MSKPGLDSNNFGQAPLSSVVPSKHNSGATDLAGISAIDRYRAASGPVVVQPSNDNDRATSSDIISASNKSHHGSGSTGKTGARIGAPVNPSSANSRQGFVLRFSNGFFLNSYRDSGEGNGTWATTDLQRSKLFSIPPIHAAKILCGEVVRVLVTDGHVDFATEVNARNEGGAVREEIEPGAVNMDASQHEASISFSEVCIETMVTLGGGVYRGFWPEIPGCEKLILFTSPKTGAGLAVPLSQLSAAAVRKQIRESDYRFEIESLGVVSA